MRVSQTRHSERFCLGSLLRVGLWRKVYSNSASKFDLTPVMAMRALDHDLIFDSEPQYPKPEYLDAGTKQQGTVVFAEIEYGRDSDGGILYTTISVWSWICVRMKRVSTWVLIRTRLLECRSRFRGCPNSTHSILPAGLTRPISTGYLSKGKGRTE